MKVAVLLTTFNRKEKTLLCLRQLQKQLLPTQISLEIYLTDDASRDGTPEAIKQSFPDVHLYSGNGSLFWAGGMRMTWNEALKKDHDYYLLLNDDTVLKETAISTLIEYSASAASPAICIGSTIDQYTGKLSYGGHKLYSSKKWGGYAVHSETEVIECDFGNANILLVPQEIVKKIGILSEMYTHGLADYDYTLTARKAGFPVLVVPGFLGHCVDDHGKNWKSGRTTLKERISYLKSPKGLAYKEYLSFIRIHFPLSYPAAFCKLWIKTFFPFIWDAFKKEA